MVVVVVVEVVVVVVVVTGNFGKKFSPLARSIKFFGSEKRAPPPRLRRGGQTAVAAPHHLR